MSRKTPLIQAKYALAKVPLTFAQEVMKIHNPLYKNTTLVFLLVSRGIDFGSFYAVSIVRLGSVTLLTRPILHCNKINVTFIQVKLDK